MNDTLRSEAPSAPPLASAPPSAIRVAARTSVRDVKVNAEPLTWELLVTEGHVRAARLRRLQPWIIALAVLLLVSGVLVSGLAPSIQPKTSVASRIQQRLGQMQMRAAAAFTTLSKLAPRLPKPDRLPADREILEVIPALLSSLNASGDLPEGNLTFGKIDEDAFWAGEWGTERVSYLKSGDTYLLAAYAHAGPATSTQPVRWVGIVKKISGKWQYASLAWSGLYMPPGLPGTSPQSVALSLDPFLPDLPAGSGTPKND